MNVTALLDQAAALRREARQVWFLASGQTPYHTSLVAAAVALERAAAQLATAHNQVSYRRAG